MLVIKFPNSSMVERTAVNGDVAGSSPALGANFKFPSGIMVLWLTVNHRMQVRFLPWEPILSTSDALLVMQKSPKLPPARACRFDSYLVCQIFNGSVGER